MKDPMPVQETAVAADARLSEGVLELADQGAGFLRDPKRNLMVKPDDAYVSADAIRKFALRGGETLAGPTAPATKGNRSVKLTRIEHINGLPAAKWTAPAPLEEMTAIDPHEALRFSTPGGPKSMWVVDMFTPIGKGQRGLIVAPPRTGKTVLLQQMAHGLAENHPDAYMIVLLIDERPEEVTEM